MRETKKGQSLVVTETGLHTIRFKDGDVEFEMTGSSEDVGRVWTLLEPSVAQAFAPDRERQSKRTASTRDTNGKSNTKPRKKARSSASSSASSTTTNERGHILDALLSASVEDFPEIGNDPTALIAGIATLSWARKTLEIDGLTIAEIHKFLTQTWRLSNTAEAYRFAFKSNPRMFRASGRPTVFQLMSRGEAALEEHLKSLDA